MSSIRRMYLAAFTVVGIVAGITGCTGTNNNNQNGGAPERQNAHQQRDVDRTPPDVLAYPDHWNNVADKCDGHGHRVYATSNKSGAPSNIFVIDDPSCGQ